LPWNKFLVTCPRKDDGGQGSHEGKNDVRSRSANSRVREAQTPRKTLIDRNATRILINNRRKKPKASPWHSFDKPRVVAAIAENAAQPVHQYIQTVLQIVAAAWP